MLPKHAFDAVRPGGYVLVAYWHYGETPRGPSLDIRPRPEDIVKRAAIARMKVVGNVIDLPPLHYGLHVHRATRETPASLSSIPTNNTRPICGVNSTKQCS